MLKQARLRIITHNVYATHMCKRLYLLLLWFVWPLTPLQPFPHSKTVCVHNYRMAQVMQWPHAIWNYIGRARLEYQRVIASFQCLTACLNNTGRVLCMYI